MSGKAAKATKKTSGKKTSSAKAGLQFPVGRIGRHLRSGRYAKRVGASASVYLAGVIEYLIAEVLEVAGAACKEAKKGRIAPRHIQMAISGDDELSSLFKGVTISEGGRAPVVHDVLLPKKSKKSKAE
eukprot:Trichotokara_eunicae@DN4161_c0_g1_i2.p1